eukprot:CAMPEP_0179003914 /NCGR_PEP_ID=MMETSP0795-20121207/12974_1 /TAXON_ID=88552 /ORGANISM="Amoebophrya sp., Strain Ameob2" /LENGTH=400 /DNA_ID=CAMNT_0020698039 /DNA_START=48 /DNA_END=1247 /DNA_ORIENTATION=+
MGGRRAMKQGSREAGASSKRKGPRDTRRRRGETASDAELRALSAHLASLGSPGLRMLGMAEDGNCLFRCFAEAVFHDANYHGTCRGHCCDVLESCEEEYRFFLDEDVDGTYKDYVRNMRRESVWGGQLELLGLCRAYAVTVVLFQKVVSSHKDAPEFVFSHYEIEMDPASSLESPSGTPGVGAATSEDEGPESDHVSGGDGSSEVERDKAGPVAFSSTGSEAISGEAPKPEAEREGGDQKQGARKTNRCGLVERRREVGRQRHIAKCRQSCAGGCVLLAYVGDEHYNLVKLPEGGEQSRTPAATLPPLSAVRRAHLLDASSRAESGTCSTAAHTHSPRGITLSATPPGGSSCEGARTPAEGDADFEEFVLLLEDSLPDIGAPKAATLADRKGLLELFQKC